MGREDAILNERPTSVIIPPPETKKIIDKTAELIARYGSSIEETLKKDEKNLPKFSFLNLNDSYRPYYDHKINELIKSYKQTNLSENKEIKLLGKKTESSDQISNINPLNQRTSSIQNELRKMIESKRLEKAQLNELKPPQQDHYSISHPNISPLDMDIIKATAQFVARNGQRFLSGLSEREAKNPQFDFLKPQHNLFGYFTYLVDSYAKCLRKEDMSKLTTYANDEEGIIRKATERYLWEKKSKESQKKKDHLDESEKAQMAQIDWYDFAVVEVITFTEEELFNTVPVSTTLNVNENINSIEANINHILEAQNGLPTHDISFEKSIHEEKKITSKPIEDVLPEPNMKIVKNYSRKQNVTETLKKDTVRCPLCKDWINIDEWPMHIKIELLDPKWKEIHQELQERKMEINLAPTGDFLGYLSDFSKYRPDLFGDVRDVVKIEEKKKIEAKAASSIWDGYAPNMTRTTANIAMLAQQTKKNIEENRKLDGQTIPVGQLNQAKSNASDYSTDVSSINISTCSRIQNNNSIPISVMHQTAQIITDCKVESTKAMVQNNAQINLDKKNNKPFKINVKVPEHSSYQNLSGQIISLQVTPHDLLFNTKTQILKCLNITSDIDKFILKSFTNSILDEKLKIVDFNLSNGAIIELDLI